MESKKLKEEIELNNEYKNTKSISNTFLKRVNAYYRYGDIDNFSEESEKKDSDSMLLGSLIHKVLEIPNFIDELIVIHTFKMKPKEKLIFNKFLESDRTPATLDLLYKSTYVNAVPKTNNKLNILQFVKELEENENKFILNLHFNNPHEILSLLNKILVNYYTDDEISHIENSVVEIRKEYAIYWQCQGVECKSLIDKLIITDKCIFIIDYKTFAQNLVSSTLKYHYVRQLSFYAQSVKELINDGYLPKLPIKVFIVGIDSKYGTISKLFLDEETLEKGKFGGYYKPNFLSLFNNNDFKPFLNAEQLQKLNDNIGFANQEFNYESLETKRHPQYMYGWNKLLELYKKHIGYSEFSTRLLDDLNI